jgi:hypothetical protein
MVYFQTKKSKSGFILESLVMEIIGIVNDHLEYLTAIWYIFSGSLVHFVVIWCILTRFGMLYQEKSGNPGSSG